MKLLFIPFSAIGGILAGIVGKKTFQALWSAFDDHEAPDPEHRDTALKKLGQYVAEPSAHMNVIVIGNERTGLWKKAFGLAPTEDLAKVVESVLNDRG